MAETTRDKAGTRKPSPKLRDGDLICVCGCLYENHTRVWNPHKQVLSFSHLGPCVVCDSCTAYKFSGRIKRVSAKEANRG